MIQMGFDYENDDIMRTKVRRDYAIACCVSAMRVRKDMQFFSEREQIWPNFVMSINGGQDEKEPRAQIASGPYAL